MGRKPDVYVTVEHVHRNGRIVPHVDTTTLGPDQTYHNLINVSTLAVFRVEGVTKRQAGSMLIAHLAGHAPVGVERVYDRRPTVVDT